MNMVEMPPREKRTPAIIAAKNLTILDDLFEKITQNSKTWPSNLDPRVEFKRMVSIGIGSRLFDADEEYADYLAESDKAAQENNGWDDSGIFNMLWVAAAYCAHAIREFQIGDEAVAWSLASDGSYWTGYVSVQYVRNVNECDAFDDRISDKNRRAANVRHEENRGIADDIKKWFLDNVAKFKSLDNAAQEATKHHNAAFRTARKHIGDVAKEKGIKLRRARKT